MTLVAPLEDDLVGGFNPQPAVPPERHACPNCGGHVDGRIAEVGGSPRAERQAGRPRCGELRSGRACRRNAGTIAMNRPERPSRQILSRAHC